MGVESRRRIRVAYADRSGNDLASEIKKYVERGYDFFCAEYKDTEEQAYQSECEIYHYWMPPNTPLSHPAPLVGTSCPYCKSADGEPST
jgi:hypothetical protein